MSPLKLIAPAVVVVTTPSGTVIVCAVPAIKVVPLILVIVKVSLSTSLSPVKGNNVTATSSLVV